MNINEAAGILPQYDEIMDRQREAQEMKSEQRDEKIRVLQMEYFNDVGTFFEWIQSIEIGESESELFKLLRVDLIGPFPNSFTGSMRRLFKEYCKEKAIEDVDG